MYTPFEQTAHDEQYRIRNRISGPTLGSTLTPNITETIEDKYNLLSFVGIVLFIILLLNV